ncbi:MAG: class I SAM-dependent methyltransferase [Bacteroidetes bacterium]|nr:class I SAM-dependent methyltransferase [Bacteroidota bacterium]
MKTNERKIHWENVFQTKDTAKVSWFQSIPETSLRLIEKLNIDKTSKIIEVGCGDSFLGDFLLDKNYSEITLLDISEKALNTIKHRLGEKVKAITFLAADVTEFSTSQKYNLWHDRAVFHFLTDENDRNKYVNSVSEKLVSGGYLILGTFSNNGPNVCSGLQVQQYSEKEITEIFSSNFKKIECFTENHQTPSGGSQNFLFSIFQRI